MGIDNDGYLFGEPDDNKNDEFIMNNYQAYLILMGFISEQNVSDEEKLIVSQAAHQLYYKLKEMGQELERKQRNEKNFVKF